mmetsp:Transcript_9619/g.17871  ORF Transcript_9619/g.17871 Transcript_9619/m.17871 type:complete len:146 (+) Transcript_9619:36-473(+)
MIPNWERRLLHARKLAVEQEENARRQRRAKLLLKEGIVGAPSTTTTQGAVEEAPKIKSEHLRHVPLATVTDQTCWEMIHYMDVQDRAERVRQAGKPGLSRALTEAALLKAKRVWPYRKTALGKPVISPAAKWKVQPFEPPLAWVG